jgi:uncharacterized protein with HEPN domain
VRQTSTSKTSSAFAGRSSSTPPGLSFQDFEADQKTIDAVVRNIEIIGEAARNIPPDVRAQMPAVAWNDASDMRNAIIHAYFAVDLDIVWDVVKTKVGPLANQISEYLRAL